jgi:hypothetical protein
VAALLALGKCNAFMIFQFSLSSSVLAGVDKRITMLRRETTVEQLYQRQLTTKLYVGGRNLRFSKLFAGTNINLDRCIVFT